MTPVREIGNASVSGALSLVVLRTSPAALMSLDERPKTVDRMTVNLPVAVHVAQIEIGYYIQPVATVYDALSAVQNAQIINLASLRNKLTFLTSGIQAKTIPSGMSQRVVVAEASLSLRDAQLAALWRRIEGFTKLPPDWFGRDSIVPSTDVAEKVRDILMNLPQALQLPQATASGDGEIGLTWFNGPDRFDTTISPDGYIVWAMKLADQFLEGDYVEQDSAGRGVLYSALDKFFDGDADGRDEANTA